MAYSSDFVKLAQSVHLAVKNRYYDDINGTDGLVYLAQVEDWVNQWLDEIENVVDRAGNVVEWKFSRSNNYELGTVATDDTTLQVSNKIDTLVSVPVRYALLTVDETIKSKWRVVNMDQILNTGQYQENCLALVGRDVYFSRAINDEEDGGTLTADVSLYLPRVDESTGNFNVLSMIKPRQLMVLGVAKNSSLPDLVRGGLSPSFLQRYQDLLNQAVQKNSYSSTSNEIGRDDMSYIRGVGF